MYTVEDQEALEAESKAAAEALIRASYEAAERDGKAAETTVGKRISRHVWDDIQAAIETIIARADNPRRGVVPAYVPLLEELTTIYKDNRSALVDVCTLSTISTVISGIFTSKKPATISTITLAIADAVLDEASVQRFFRTAEAMAGEEDREHHLHGAALEKNFKDAIEKRVQSSYKRTYAVRRMIDDGIPPLHWPKEARLKLGSVLLDAVMTAAPIFTITKGANNVSSIVPQDWLAETWAHNIDLLCKVAHKFIPLIIKPNAWQSPYGGAYYGAYRPFTKLIRLYDGDNQFIKDYQKRLTTVDLTPVYAAINALQNTAWTININILKAANAIIDTGGNLGNLPQTEPYAKLPELPNPTDEELKEHKKKAVALYRREEARKSKAWRTIIAVKTAENYAKYDELYFPWNMDYRGRLYPLTATLSPQGDDLQKSLILFKNPVPCKNEDDWKWLAIHGANTAGVDKVPFEERIAWVKTNEDAILTAAKDPLEDTRWHSLSSSESPMCFLAFCYEWARLKVYQNNHGGSCIGFASGLPIAFDGTCSGLQHFSALLRDEIGGHAVNLTNTGKVQDIYTIVADKVNTWLLKDAVSGTIDEVKRGNDGTPLQYPDGSPRIRYGSRTLAQAWVTFNRDKFGTDGIKRKVCKRSVMTLAYGSGQYGFKENLITDIIKPYRLEHPDDSPFTPYNTNQAAVYMARLIWDGVKSTVVKAVEGMEYLKNLSALVSNDANVVTWHLPDGLPVQQNYITEQQKEIQLRVAGKKLRFYFKDSNGEIDRRRQRQGIAPNYIHSLDAYHMRCVIRAAAAEGITNFAMIHDSFGTDMGRAADLYRIIREQFVAIYAGHDHLQDFAQEMADLIESNSQLPPAPTFGTLDIKEVLNSQYCFA